MYTCFNLLERVVKSKAGFRVVFLISSLFLLVGCAETLSKATKVVKCQIEEAFAEEAYYPKASPDAQKLIIFQSNVEGTNFYVDGKFLIRGKQILVLVADRPHIVKAKPDNYIAKEEYIQPPYKRGYIVRFHYLLEDRLVAGLEQPILPKVARTKQAPPVAIEKPEIVDKVDQPIRTHLKNPDAVSIIIAEKDYQNPDVPKVKYAVRDATVVKSYLINTLGYRKGNIIYEMNASKGVFERIFGTTIEPHGQLYNLIKPYKSDVFIYYSGHGLPDPKTKKAYFCPTDANPNYIRLSGYPLDTFYKNLAKLPARSVTVVIDACFCGTSEAGSLLKDMSPMVIILKDSAKPFKNGVVLTSCSRNEVSSWYPDKRHGLFTYYLLKGLRGEADLNHDKKITISEIYSFVKKNVSYMARRLHNRKQTPELLGESRKAILVKYK